MDKIDKKALVELAKESKKELKKNAKRWRKARVTKLVRFSTDSHKQIKELSKKEKMTMSKTLDFIISNFFKY